MGGNHHAVWGSACVMGCNAVQVRVLRRSSVTQDLVDPQMFLVCGPSIKLFTRPKPAPKTQQDWEPGQSTHYITAITLGQEYRVDHTTVEMTLLNLRLLSNRSRHLAAASTAEVAAAAAEAGVKLLAPLRRKGHPHLVHAVENLKGDGVLPRWSTPLSGPQGKK